MKTSAPAPARPSTASRARTATSRRRRSRRSRRRARGVQRGVRRDRRPDRAGRHHRPPRRARRARPARRRRPRPHAERDEHDCRGRLVVDRPVAKQIKASIKDPDLGHTITADIVVRHFPWPAGQPVGAKQFEIVGVWVSLAAGSRYSASIEPSMLSLVAASPAQTVMPDVRVRQAVARHAAEGCHALEDDRRLGLLQGQPRHDERAEPGLQPAALHRQHDRQERSRRRPSPSS